MKAEFDLGAFQDDRLLIGGNDFQIKNGRERVVFEGKLEIDFNHKSRCVLSEVIEVLFQIRDAIPADKPTTRKGNLAYAAVDLKEFRNALYDRFGSKSDAYTLLHIDQLTGPAGAAVAHNTQEHTMWVLIDNTDGSHDVNWNGLFLAETAAKLTEFFNTLVVPAGPSSFAKTLWAGKVRGPFVAYKFALVDKPQKLTP